MKDLLDITGLILTDHGYSVIRANDGREALQKVRDLPDLVLLDLVMPGLSGLEVCRILKSDPKTKSIPVVMFSVLGNENDRTSAKRAGCEGYFVKPFTPDELLAQEHVVMFEVIMICVSDSRREWVPVSIPSFMQD